MALDVIAEQECISSTNPNETCATVFSTIYVAMPHETLFATENHRSKMNRVLSGRERQTDEKHPNHTQLREPMRNEAGDAHISLRTELIDYTDGEEVFEAYVSIPNGITESPHSDIVLAVFTPLTLRALFLLSFAAW
jgi:hypothetical protein